MKIEELLTFAAEADASDLHLSAGSVPMVRVSGRIQKLNLSVLTSDEMKELAYSVMNEDQRKRFEKNKEVDFSKQVDGVARFRVNIFYQMKGLAAAFRTIPDRIRSFDELGLPSEIFKDFSLKDRGLILLTGPTGCGKSTTLAAMIDYINEYKELHIITIEDPVEYFHKSKNCLINQRELGAHTHSFANALRAALREDPDVILVGEMRDLETVALALTAAETGHLVLATLHTASSAKAVDRIIDIFPVNQKAQVRSMLSESLVAVIAQKLLPLKGGNGRVPACEIMIANVAVRNLIREDKIFQIPSVIQAGAKSGMQTLDQDLQRLVHQGKIERAVAAQVADNPRLFQVDLGR
ncbi:type IV pilus twitching motility protein PilT [candidate division KSB1 bacterium]|nr:type IV pilus twitching motility protein PilT [candidate division KSB1 bacterium]